MKKILPVNLETNMITECWNFYKLSVLLANDRYYPWFVEHFNELRLYHTFQTQYYGFDSIDFFSPDFSEVIEVVDLSLSRANFVDSLMREINSDHYIMLYMDLFFLKSSRAFGRGQAGHEVMIIGYDTDRSIFTFVIINEATKFWEIQEIGFDLLREAYGSALGLLRETPQSYMVLSAYHYPACTLSLKEARPRKVHLTRLYNALLRTKYGKSGDVTDFADAQKKPIYNGLSVYKGYYELLVKYINDNGHKCVSENEYILLGIKKLLECKAGWIIRLNYLKERRQMNVPGDVIDAISKLCHIIQEALMQLEKYSISGKERLLCDFAAKMKLAEKMDHQNVLDLIEMFEEQLTLDINEICGCFERE